MLLPPSAAGAQPLWCSVTILCIVLVLLQTQRSTTPKGDLLATYLKDLLALFTVFCLATTPAALGLGAAAAAANATATLLRARKLAA